jgi:ABC-type methionine transport system permease subunit
MCLANPSFPAHSIHSQDFLGMVAAKQTLKIKAVTWYARLLQMSFYNSAFKEAMI